MMDNNTKNVMFSSKTDNWSTPQDLFELLDSEFHFTLDVCADENNHKCEKFFTQEDDGLKQKWSGVCWMNPPYGRGIKHWVEKAYKAIGGGIALYAYFLLAQIQNGGMITSWNMLLI